MDLGLKGKTALVTGSTVGIGFAIARTLASEGATVMVNGRTGARVTEAVAKLRADVPGAQVTGIAADLGTAAGVGQIVAEHPDVDILVNNLGIYEPKPFEEISDADWLRFFEVNVMSGVRLSRHYLPRMKQRDWGRIVFVSSESGVNIPAEMIHYGMTKSAQISIARGLAETTGFVDQLAKERGIPVAEVERDFFRTTRPASLLQRFIQPDEVASLVAYVCSPLAAATNGAALRVEGGCVRSMI
jgi:NAD(P)-dependent dehydrogenase (short-subunit alcohol dehydrogenase family)